MHIYTSLSIYGLGDWQPALKKQEWGLKRFYGANFHHSDSLPLLKYHNNYCQLSPGSLLHSGFGIKNTLHN